MLIVQIGPTLLGAFIDQVPKVIVLVVEAVGQWKIGQDWCMVDAIYLDFVKNFVGVLQRLGDVAKNAIHFLLGLEPFLLAVEHHVLIGEFLACREADETLMGIGILLVDEVGIVGADKLDVQFTGKLNQGIIDKTLFLVGLMVGMGNSRLVTLQLQIIVVTKDTLEPTDGLPCLAHLAVHDELGHLTTQASRAADNALVVLLQFAVVGTWMIVHALGPSVRDYFDEVLVALEVLSQQDKVVTVIPLVNAVMAGVIGDINLANSLMPNILPWSVIAIPRMPSAIALSTSALTGAWPSRMEYCECTCRCTNGIIDVSLK